MTKEQADKITALIDALSKMLPNTSSLVQISELNPGDGFKFADRKWVLLGDEQNGKLVITTESIGDYSFEEENNCNDWRKSSLRKYLNSEFLETLKREDLLMFTSDLIADDGLTDYGSSEDFVFILSDVLYRKYRYKIPEYGMYMWAITPYTTRSSDVGLERCVCSNGSLDCYGVNNTFGVAPVCLLKPETRILKI